MTLSLILLCLWVVLAFVMAALPAADHHWRRAYVLMALGLPLLALLVWEGGWRMGVLGLVVGALVLRWPLRYLWRWMRAQMGR